MDGAAQRTSELALEAPSTSSAGTFALIGAALRMQLHMTRHNVEDLMPVLTVPLLTVASMAVFVHAGRPELAGSALVATLLMTLGQMGLFVGSEVVARDRNLETLPLSVVARGKYLVVLATRIFALSSLGVLGFLEGWLIVRFCFGLHVTLYWPVPFAATVLATTLATTGTCLVTAAFTSLLKNPRTLQHALNGPLYLLGGVLVPVAYLPGWAQPLARVDYFYWAAELLRASLRPERPHDVALGLTCIAALGVTSGLVGAWLLGRAFDHLRREGTLGLT